ncbi:MAG: hypothetical protein U0P45_04265, partial [Acidimicrobiales bacterium]
RASAIVGPQSPTIAGNVFPLWPPRSTADLRPVVERGELRPAAGYTIAGTRRWPVERAVTVLSGSRLPNDLPNEATPAFKIQSDDPNVTSRFLGIEVLYRSNAHRYRLTDRDVEFGICSPADTRTASCQAPED